MSKTEADRIEKIKIWWLVRQARGMNGSQNNEIFAGENTDVALQFTYTLPATSKCKKRDVDYQVQITKTPCHFGGFRSWFKCPLYVNGKYCGRRVGVLYRAGDLFGCRKCYNLTYKSRNLSGKDKRFGSTLSFPDLEEIRERIRHLRYKGKPTRRLLQYVKKKDRSRQAYEGMVLLFDEKIKKIKRSKKYRNDKS